jgi:hypothetical protein
MKPLQPMPDCPGVAGEKRRRRRRAARLAAVLLLAALCSGCITIRSPGTVARMEGFDAQWRGFKSLTSEPFGIHETEIRVKIIVVEDMTDMQYPGAVGTYSHPEGVIRIVGKKVKGKLILNPSVLGHEIQHALEYQDPYGVFINPDIMDRYGY